MTQEDKSTFFFAVLFPAGSAMGIGGGVFALLVGDILFSITFFTLGIMLLIWRKQLFKLHFEEKKAVSK